MSLIDDRLQTLGIVLPDAMPPVVAGYAPAFLPFVQTGDQVHLSGRLSKRNGDLLLGKVGAELTLEQGKFAAREVAIELLAVLKSAVGDLDRVAQDRQAVRDGQQYVAVQRAAPGCGRGIGTAC